MKNFLVKIRGCNEQVGKDIQKVFMNHVVPTNEKESVRRKDLDTKYILSDSYVDRYIIPFLFRTKECIHVINNVDISKDSLHRPSPISLSIECYGSCLYLEGNENEMYEQVQSYKEYKIRNQSFLLIHGEIDYIENKKIIDKNHLPKNIYDYLNHEKDPRDINTRINNICGSFVLIYVQCKKGAIQIYFGNDIFGKKSFLYSYINNGILLTNQSGLFIHYDMNYLLKKEKEYAFQEDSISDHLNLVNYEKSFIENKENKTEKDSVPLKVLPKQGKLINHLISKDIPPHYIYTLNICNGEITFEKFKKKSCIYTCEYTWEERVLSIEEIVKKIIDLVEFAYSFNSNNEKLIECGTEYRENTERSSSSSLGLVETRVNNLLVHGFVTLLRYIIKSKIEQFFIQNENESEMKGSPSIGIFFSGGIDSTLLTVLTIIEFFQLHKNGLLELVNVAFDENATDRYTSLIAFEKILSLFPNYNIRLLFIDVIPEQLIQYEKLIYSLISPNITVMDYNISAALFFANTGNAYEIPKSFFETAQWSEIKRKTLLYLNVPKKIQEDDSVIKIKSFSKDIETKEQNHNKSYQHMKNNKCTLCDFIRHEKCVHKCCALCCRKLRYIVRTANRNNYSNHHEEKEAYLREIYEEVYDEGHNRRIYYLLNKKNKVLIDFELFAECLVHKDLIYDYKKITSLFQAFYDEREKIEKEKEKEEQTNIISNRKERKKDEFVETFISKSGICQMDQKEEEEEKNEKEKIKNLFASKKKNKEGKVHYYHLDENENLSKKEETEEQFVYLSKSIYYQNEKSFVHGNEKKYLPQYNLLIIGSGADEFFGGYSRQNIKKNRKNTNFKMNEMLKDIRRLWNRNLYRDDRVISFSSSTRKEVFYPYLDPRLMKFLFSFPFYVIQSPISFLELGWNLSKDEMNMIDDKIRKFEVFFDYNSLQNVDEYNEIYETIKANQMNKWILRMCLCSLHMKEVMFFKKKAIQFGSKSKHIQKYMLQYVLNQVDGERITDSLGKKGIDEYIPSFLRKEKLTSS